MVKNRYVAKNGQKMDKKVTLEMNKELLFDVVYE